MLLELQHKIVGLFIIFQVVEQVDHQVEAHQVARMERAYQVIQVVKAVTLDLDHTQDPEAVAEVPLWS